MQDGITSLFTTIIMLVVTMHGLAAQTSWTRFTSSNGDFPKPTGSDDQTACVTADFNGDQRDDFIIASRGSGGLIELWLSTNTSGGFTRHPLDRANVRPEAGGDVHDIDGDGDLDLVLGQDITDNHIFWWENPAPIFSGPWKRHTIKSGGGTKHHDQVFGDFDGDGTTELVSWNQGSSALLLFDIPAAPKSATSWQSRKIASGSARDEGLVKADIDCDGIQDIVGAGRWWKHTGSGRYTEYVIAPAMNYTRVAVGQVIPGGRPEVFLVPGDDNGDGYWYRWDGTNWQSRRIGHFRHCHTLQLADFDGDNFLDLLTGEMWGSKRQSCELVIHYGNGQGTFRKTVIATGNGIHEGRVADIDGDGDPDIVHKPLTQGAPRVDVWRNDRKVLRLDRWKRHLIDGGMANNAMFVRSGDLDGDGDEDVVAGKFWYVNPNDSAATWKKEQIGDPLNNIAAIYDFDCDGDLDLFGTQGSGASPNAEFAWAENDGKGRFKIHTNIQRGSGDFLQGVAVGHFLGNDSLQIALSWHAANQGLQVLTLPPNPATQNWVWRRASMTSLDEDISIGDIDLDGDTDLMLGTVWIESPGAVVHVLGKVSDLKGVGGTPVPDRNRLVDIDRDGDLDVVVSLEQGCDVIWFENPLPKGTPTASWKRHLLGWAQGQGFSLDVADFDRDGDVDVVLGEHLGSTVNRVLIFENQVWSHDRTIDWRVHVVDTQAKSIIDHHDGTVAVDIDHDGDLDIVSVGWANRKVWWFENLAVGGPVIEAPVMTPTGGSFRGFRTVKISTVTPGTTIRFTTDGKNPTSSSRPYTGPITLSATTEIRARAFNYAASSDIGVATFARLIGELGYWRFDTGTGLTAFDDARDQHHAKIRGAAWTKSGKLQGALTFAGKGDRVEIGAMDVTGMAMTISGWVFPLSFSHLPMEDARIISKAYGVSEQHHYWMLSTLKVGSDTRLRFRLKANGTTSTLIADSGHLATNRWSHVAAIYDGTRMFLYLNGIEVGRRFKSGAIDTNPHIDVWIGDQPPSGSRPFHGSIDEVRVFDRPLSSLELRALAQDQQFTGFSSYGRGTPFCGENPRALPTRSPRVGDSDFAISSVDGPVNSIGILLIGFAPSRGFLFNGVNILIDLNLPIVTHWVWSDPSGRNLTPAPLNLAPPGTLVYTQFVWFNTPGIGCTLPPGVSLSATDRMDTLIR